MLAMVVYKRLCSEIWHFSVAVSSFFEPTARAYKKTGDDKESIKRSPDPTAA
jgi:hypothetical protein